MTLGVERYEPVIGLEVHAQLASRTKLFCGCPTSFGAPPNTHVCPVCLGLPGALPVLNEAAVDLALRVGLALGCEVRERSVFARKSYFYPDLAKGYQISQYDQPLLEHGAVGSVPLTRVHVEEDAAKTIHGAASTGATLVDFNRAGVPLVEIVSEPAIASAEEAESYLRTLSQILVFARVNDGNLEEGSFRCDANVSLRPAGTTELGTRTELKNINSFRFVRKALEHEIARQEALLSAGRPVARETRSWDERAKRTVAMRGKEEAHDYRYFPDPDLPPLDVDAARLERVRASMPELATARQARWVAALGLTPYDAAVLGSRLDVADLFDEAARALGAGLETGKALANFVQSEVMRHAELLDASRLVELLALIEDGTINRNIAKDVLDAALATGERPRAIVESRGLAQMADEAAVRAVLERVVADHPKQVAELRAGKRALEAFLVGQVMKATSGKANPVLVKRLLGEILGES